VPLEPTIIRRIDAALAELAARELQPRAIYLTPSDYWLLRRTKTARWRRATGSSAIIWPLSYGDVPLVSDKTAGLTIPVSAASNLNRRGSCIYSTTGIPVAVPRRPPQ
jgi:hypothetical protein